MIELTQGDILEADTEALVNTVNCVGNVLLFEPRPIRLAWERLNETGWLS